MKLFITTLLFWIAVNGKEELTVNDCGGDTSLLTIGSVKDLKTTGRVSKYSELNVFYSAAENKRKLDPLDLFVKIELKKKVGYWYLPLPTQLIDKVGAKLATLDGSVKYLGDRIFKLYCPFHRFYKSCLPPKGPHLEKILMEPIITTIKRLIFGPLGRWIASGWYQLNMKAITAKNELIFCLNSKLRIFLGII